MLRPSLFPVAIFAALLPLPGNTGTAEISLADLLGRTRATPYECTSYDRRSESCELLATYRDTGSGAISSGQFVLPGTPPMTGRVTAALDARGCSDTSALQIEIDSPDPALKSSVESMTRSIYSRLGTICVSFHDLGQGKFRQITRNARGKIIPGGDRTVQFFAEPRKLRVQRGW